MGARSGTDPLDVKFCSTAPGVINTNPTRIQDPRMPAFTDCFDSVPPGYQSRKDHESKVHSVDDPYPRSVTPPGHLELKLSGLRAIPFLDGAPSFLGDCESFSAHESTKPATTTEWRPVALFLVAATDSISPGHM